MILRQNLQTHHHRLHRSLLLPRSLHYIRARPSIIAAAARTYESAEKKPKDEPNTGKKRKITKMRSPIMFDP